jgi:hypothetical protein
MRFPLVLFENCHDCILLGRGAVAKARRLYANTGRGVKVLNRPRREVRFYPFVYSVTNRLEHLSNYSQLSRLVLGRDIKKNEVETFSELYKKVLRMKSHW